MDLKKKISLLEFVRIQFDLLGRLGVELDLITLRARKNNTCIEEVNKDLKIIYRE